MKKKISLILLTVLFILTSACTVDKLEKAQEYMANGNMKGAEKLYKKVLLEEKNHEAYKGLIEIYNNQNKIEELSDIMGESIKYGYTPEEHAIYVKVIAYYDAMNEREKVIELIGDTFSNVSLPISVYKDYLLRDELPKDMDLIEMKCGDVTNNKQNEIAVAMGKPQEGINMNYYELVKFKVYNLKGQIIYEDFKDGGYLLYPEISMVDLNNDGVKDLYYNTIYDSISTAYTMAKVVSLKDGDVELIYSDGIKNLDIEIEKIDEDRFRIYSEKMDKSYDIDLKDPMNQGSIPQWREVYEKLRKDENGSYKIQTNFEIKDYGEVQVDHDLLDGEIKAVDFQIEPYNGKVK